ncbi:LssY C-terminal domain-containing protein [Microbacterium sp. P26]|uniref:LssY C-terminal domain-containing protein n=1 Tax=Microbacterium TaxID=33882 RepID=UPI00203FFA49|nr:LssY C-terminal domain-containing protein [Microbacterium sp. P26]MCM3503287.1 LssY C-terminal domain-containing protein [Microbacterium sp. P26]
MTGRRRWSIGRALDGFFFVFAGLAAIWLAYLSFTASFSLGWAGIAMAIAFWVLLAYLVLPRLHRILTAVYVPDYFMGRTRTSDGLLGDPVNLAFQGEREAIEAVMAAAGWIPADPVSLRSSWRIITSTLRRRSYPRAPVSPLFLFGRMQDLAYQQEVAGSPAQRHHVRLWKCPDGWLLPGGRRVGWLAAGTFDRAVGLSLFTLQVTHRIDADTDIERDHIVGTVRAVPGVAVDVIRDFSTGYHSRNGGGDSITTDGDLPIVDVSAVRVAGVRVAAVRVAGARVEAGEART